MFGSATLDLAIGVIYVILLVSLMVTAASELVASWLRWRAKHLWAGMESLLGSGDHRKNLYAHPLVKGLKQPAHSRWAFFRPQSPGPSYIPSRTFALALLDVIRQPHVAADRLKTDLETLNARVRELPPDEIAARAQALLASAHKNAPELRGAIEATAARMEAAQKSVAGLAEDAKRTGIQAAVSQAAGQFASLTLRESVHALTRASKLTPASDSSGLDDLGRVLLVYLDEAAGDIERVRQNVEVWFNNGMDRVAGWYKRKMQALNMVIALGFAIVLNVDLWRITERLWTDQALRDAVVVQATEFAEKSIESSPPPKLEPSTVPITVDSPQVSEGGSVTVSWEANAASLKEGAVCAAEPAGLIKLRLTSEKPNECSFDVGPVEKDAYVTVSVAPTKTPKQPAGKVNVLVLREPARRIDHLRAAMETTRLPVGWATCAPEDSDLAKWSQYSGLGWLVYFGFTPRAPATAAPAQPAGAPPAQAKPGDREIPPWCPGGSLRAVPGMFIGWLLTAIAASLGAPFWFDALNKVITIRSAGKAPEERPKSPKAVPQPREAGDQPASGK